MNPTQNRILFYLKMHPTASASTISQALGMTAANIRYHLAALEKARLVEVEITPLSKGRGHPAHNFHLSLEAQPHNLGCLADILFSEVVNETDSGAVLDLAETLADRLIKKGSNLTILQSKRGPLTQKLTHLVQALEPFHYQARWEAHPTSPHFILGQCPYRAIVDRHPILCQMDAFLLAKLVGRSVKQIARVGQGTSPAISCIFEIELQRKTIT